MKIDKSFVITCATSRESLVSAKSVVDLAHNPNVILTARNSREAVAILGRDQRVAQPLTDIVMPGRSGAEVANEALRLRRPIKVLLTSGYAQEVLAAQSANNNFPIVTRPCRPQELAEELGRFLRTG